MAGNKAGEDPQATKHEQLKAEQKARETANNTAANEKQNQKPATQEPKNKQPIDQAAQAEINRSVEAARKAVSGETPNTALDFDKVATYQEYFNRLQNGNSIDNNIRLNQINQEKRDQVIAEKSSTEANDVPTTKDKLAWIRKRMTLNLTEAPKSMKAQLEREAREMANYKPFEILE